MTKSSATVDKCMELQIHTSYTIYIYTPCIRVYTHTHTHTYIYIYIYIYIYVYMVSCLLRSFVLKTCTWISVLLKCVKLKEADEELLSVWWLQYSRLERRAVSCFYVKVSMQYQQVSILYAMPHQSSALFDLHLDTRYNYFLCCMQHSKTEIYVIPTSFCNSVLKHSHLKGIYLAKKLNNNCSK
jgi:hypothetical protein